MNLSSFLPPNQFRYYYGTLPKEEAKAYDTLLSGMLRYRSEIHCHGCTVQRIKQLFRFLTMDIPELFFVKSVQIRYADLASTHCTVIPYYRFSAQETHDTLVYMMQKCEKLISATSSCDDFQKEKAIHDFIATTVQYKDIDAPYSHEAPGALLFHIAVCEGIAKAFKYLADRVNLTSIVVFGVSHSHDNGGSHAWNLVRISGVFYHIDTTFDTTISTSCVRYDYFNLSDTDAQRTHSWADNIPSCPQTCGVYEKSGAFFSNFRALARFISKKSDQGGPIVFKLPMSLKYEQDRLISSIEYLIANCSQCGLAQYSKYLFSPNLAQMVFQIDYLS